ncbi:hypothetical protein KCU85_g39, partial [Aureobasidium melanogenum]
MGLVVRPLRVLLLPSLPLVLSYVPRLLPSGHPELSLSWSAYSSFSFNVGQLMLVQDLVLLLLFQTIARYLARTEYRLCPVYWDNYYVATNKAKGSKEIVSPLGVAVLIWTGYRLSHQPRTKQSRIKVERAPTKVLCCQENEQGCIRPRKPRAIQSPYNPGWLPQVGIFAKGRTKQAERRSTGSQDSLLSKCRLQTQSSCKWKTTEAGQASPHPYRDLKPGPSDAFLSVRFGTSYLSLNLRYCFWNEEETHEPSPLPALIADGGATAFASASLTSAGPTASPHQTACAVYFWYLLKSLSNRVLVDGWLRTRPTPSTFFNVDYATLTEKGLRRAWEQI